MRYGGGSVTVRVATWSARHPGRAIAGWVVFVAVCLTVGTGVGTNSGEIKDFWIGEAGRAEAIAAAGGLTPPPVEQILVTSAAGPLDARSADAAARDVAERMRALPDVAEVSDPVRSTDASAVRVAVMLVGDADTAKKAVPTLLERTAAVQAEHPGLTIGQTGSASISVGLDEKLGRDLARTEAISLPITVLILFLVFGAVLAAGVPVLLALSAIIGAVGLYGLASWIFPDAGGAVMSVVFLLGMAVGVDYSLFYLKRVREERARSGNTITHAAAVELAAATSGRSIWFSGLAVVLSLAGLYLVDDVIFSSIATGAILVVAVAVASSLTVLPALLVALGPRMEGRRHARDGGRHAGGTWARMLRPAMRCPVATLLVGMALTAALALPAASMRLGSEGTETFPTSVPAVATHDGLTRSFPAEGVTHLLAVHSGPTHAAHVVVALGGLAERTRGDALFAQGADPQIRTSADATTSTLQIAVPYPENSSEARASLDRLRDELAPESLGRVPGGEYAVTGDVARGVDYSAHQAQRIPWVIGFVSLATLIVMIFAFGSAVLAMLGVVLNLAAVAGAWGALTLVFQGSSAEGLLGFTSTGFIGSRMPLMIFAILVGLSTDYQIFVVSRIREAVLRGVPTRQAVLDGITSSASVVTSAAVIMISIFVSFMFIDRIELKQVGLGLTVAVLFDAVVLRILILPAAMTLLSESCWWPIRSARQAPAPETAPRPWRSLLAGAAAPRR